MLEFRGIEKDIFMNIGLDGEIIKHHVVSVFPY